MSTELALVPSIAEAIDELDAAYGNFFGSKTEAEWEAHDAYVARNRAAEGDEEFLGDDRRWQVVGIRKRHQDAVAEAQRGRTLQRTRAMMAIANFSTDVSVVVVGGPAGCGKTFAATGWMLQRVSEGSVWNQVFVTAAEVQRLGLWGAQLGKPAQEWILLTRQAHRAVIDDLGAESEPGLMAERLAEVLRERVTRHNRLIITTRLPSLEAVQERYGTDVATSILRHGMFVPCDESVG